MIRKKERRQVRTSYMGKLIGTQRRTCPSWKAYISNFSPWIGERGATVAESATGKEHTQGECLAKPKDGRLH
jgi:hypothetical protein